MILAFFPQPNLVQGVLRPKATSQINSGVATLVVAYSDFFLLGNYPPTRRTRHCSKSQSRKQQQRPCSVSLATFSSRKQPQARQKSHCSKSHHPKTRLRRASLQTFFHSKGNDPKRDRKATAAKAKTQNAVFNKPRDFFPPENHPNRDRQVTSCCVTRAGVERRRKEQVMPKV